MSDLCVDFSKAQLGEVFKAHQEGRAVEFESFAPYLADYNTETGAIDRACLVQADIVGLAIARVVHPLLPHARMVSLYDDYNVDTEASPAHTSTCQRKHLIEEKYEGDDALTLVYPDAVRARFKESVRETLGAEGLITLSTDTDGTEYLLVSEEQKVLDVDALVPLLEAEGRGVGIQYIERDGEKITFVNPNSENPKFQKITLRTKSGRWLCAALDAAGYVKRENLFITHLVILPIEYRDQQDKVWEILRVLGIKPTNYHNIYYSLDSACGDVAMIIKSELEKFV